LKPYLGSTVNKVSAVVSTPFKKNSFESFFSAEADFWKNESNENKKQQSEE
jgi:hypothetical protein